MNWKREKEEDDDGEIKWYILLLLLILLLFVIIICVILYQRGKLRANNAITTVPGENTGGGVELVIDPNAKNSSYKNDNTMKQGVAIAGRESITIPANQKEVSVDFYNPKENAELFYLTFELRLYDDNEQDYEVLYTSGLVDPGKHIYQITLSHTLEKGVYNAVIHVQPYRMNDEKTLTNNADLRIALIVK